jgi:hypothetical protein
MIQFANNAKSLHVCMHAHLPNYSTLMVLVLVLPSSAFWILLPKLKNLSPQ